VVVLARSADAHRETTAALVARVAAGDERAFVALAGRLRTPALRLAAGILGDTGEAEDAVQAALVKLWRKAESYRPELGAAESWFSRIVVNCCLDRRRTIRAVAPIEAAADLVDNGDGPAEAAEAQDRARRTQAAVAQLNPRQRAAILLFYGADQSTAEVAEALGTTPKAVEGLLARARAELARMLDGLGQA
jgi:RNA polymerase sigma-70 factor (ECF subfamily)